MTSRPVRRAISSSGPLPAPDDVSDYQQSTARHDNMVVPSTPPVLPRLFLAPALGDTAVLQGGWWPHSFDPVAELPGLVLALCARYGSVRELRLHSTDWYRPFNRLAVDAGVVHLVWADDLDPAHMIVTTSDYRTVGLLVVAPHTDATAATRAMAIAADPANTRPARDILVA